MAKYIYVRFEKVKSAPEDLQLPKRATLYSAGYDFYLPQDITIKSHSCSGIIPSGIKVYLNDNTYLGITVRSSLAMKGLRIPQGEAIIDSDYVDNPTNEGEIGLAFYNDSNEDITLKKGSRCAQGIIKSYHITDEDAITLFSKAKENVARISGFGSTGE